MGVGFTVVEIRQRFSTPLDEVNWQMITVDDYLFLFSGPGASPQAGLRNFGHLSVQPLLDDQQDRHASGLQGMSKGSIPTFILNFFVLGFEHFC